tara:strand:- start:1062 stop:1490 length:429 start_codon:yes stop_codon:yes gene_type:complete
MSKFRMVRISWFLLFFAPSVLATDFACPETKEGYVTKVPKGVNVQWLEETRTMKAANVFLPGEYEGEKLFSAQINVGEWVYEGNIEKMAPIFSSNLEIRKSKESGKQFVQVFLGKQAPETKLLLQYGQVCFFTIVVPITHNK